jgi:uncharacterized protein (TIGR03086 family)
VINHEKGAAMEPNDQLREILPRVVTTVERIRPDQLDAPTPCTEFRVRDVIDHLVVVGTRFAHLFRGEEPSLVDPPAADATEVPVTELWEVFDDLVDAAQSPGAMDRTISLPVAEMSGDAFARLFAVDGLVHGWDLATATGQAYEPPDEVVYPATSFALRSITPAMRHAGMFHGPATPPPGATPLEHLIAHTGRKI